MAGVRTNGGLLALCCLLAWPCLVGAASTSVKDPLPFEFHLLSAAAQGAHLQTFEAVSLESPAETGTSDSEWLSHHLAPASGAPSSFTFVSSSLDSLGNLINTHQAPLSSGAAFTISMDSSDSDAFDDSIRPDPRPRMRKWMLAVLLLGGLVRYLTSPSYVKFVSEVLDPWAS